MGNREGIGFERSGLDGPEVVELPDFGQEGIIVEFERVEVVTGAAERGSVRIYREKLLLVFRDLGTDV